MFDTERLEANRDLKISEMLFFHSTRNILRNFTLWLIINFEGMLCRSYRRWSGGSLAAVQPRSASDGNKVVRLNYANTIHVYGLYLSQVIENEDEWGVSYEEVLAYLKASYPKMVSNLR